MVLSSRSSSALGLGALAVSEINRLPRLGAAFKRFPLDRDLRWRSAVHRHLEGGHIARLLLDLEVGRRQCRRPYAPFLVVLARLCVETAAGVPVDYMGVTVTIV